MRRRGRNAGFRLQTAGLAHARPVDEVRHILMVHNDRHALEWRSLLLPALRCSLPTFTKGFGARLVSISVGAIELREPAREYVRDLGDIAWIEMDMRIARRVNVAQRTVDHLRDLEPRHELRRFHEPWRAGLDAIVTGLREQQGQPADLELGARADHEVRIADPRYQARPRFDAMRVLAGSDRRKHR